MHNIDFTVLPDVSLGLQAYQEMIRDTEASSLWLPFARRLNLECSTRKSIVNELQFVQEVCRKLHQNQIETTDEMFSQLGIVFSHIKNFTAPIDKTASVLMLLSVTHINKETRGKINKFLNSEIYREVFKSFNLYEMLYFFCFIISYKVFNVDDKNMLDRSIINMSMIIATRLEKEDVLTELEQIDSQNLFLIIKLLITNTAIRYSEVNNIPDKLLNKSLVFDSRILTALIAVTEEERWRLFLCAKYVGSSALAKVFYENGAEDFLKTKAEELDKIETVNNLTVEQYEFFVDLRFFLNSEFIIRSSLYEKVESHLRPYSKIHSVFLQISPSALEVQPIDAMFFKESDIDDNARKKRKVSWFDEKSDDNPKKYTGRRPMSDITNVSSEKTLSGEGSLFKKTSLSPEHLKVVLCYQP